MSWRGRSTAAAGVVLAFGLSGCGGNDGSAQPVATVTVIETTTVTAEPALDQDLGDEATEAAIDLDDSSLEPDPEATAETQVLPEDSRGRELGLNDMFSADDEWAEDRFDIADQAQIRGLGAEISCREAPIALELRLARQFEALQMNVGQANDSPSSDGAVVVEIQGNGKQLDIREISFDRIQPFDVSVSAMNAVKVLVSFQQESCGSPDAAIAVISGLSVT
jgi:hypothetical protein